MSDQGSGGGGSRLRTNARAGRSRWWLGRRPRAGAGTVGEGTVSFSPEPVGNLWQCVLVPCFKIWLELIWDERGSRRWVQCSRGDSPKVGGAWRVESKAC